MNEHITTIIFAIALIILIIISLILKKHMEEKRRQNDRRQEEQKKQNTLNLWMNKIKENETAARWLETVAAYCEKSITTYPKQDHVFECLAYQQDFVIGKNLQEKYLVHMKDFVYCEKPIRFFCYNFTENELPELKSSEVNPFAKAFAELIKKHLRSKGIDVEIGKHLAIINSDGDNNYNEEERRFIYTINYTRQKVNANW